MATQTVPRALDVRLLAALATGSAPGYALARRLRASQATVYEALRRLEDARLVARPRERHVYRLTRIGRHRLRSELREWRLIARAVAAAA